MNLGYSTIFESGPAEEAIECGRHERGDYSVSSQLVPKSTRTLVNSYPFLVNSYLTFGQLVPTPSQLVPESKKRGRVERDRRRIGKSRS